MNTFSIIAFSPSHVLCPDMVIAAARAGEMGILDLGSSFRPDDVRDALTKVKRFAEGHGRWGVRWGLQGTRPRPVSDLSSLIQDKIDVIVLHGMDQATAVHELADARQLAHKVFGEACSFEEALALEAAGFDGIVLKGNEAGGWIGGESSFILLQRAYRKLRTPFWLQGGVGLNTAAAAYLAGAAGLALCEQLWLTEEAPFSVDDRNMFRQMDGNDTVCLGEKDTFFRCSRFHGKETRSKLEQTLAADGDWRAGVSASLDGTSEDWVMALGQDIAMAAHLAEHYGTVGNVMRAMHARLRSNLRTAVEHSVLAEGAPLARIHGTRYPIMQGPMARVSDIPEFSRSVAEGGGLPFMGLSVLRASEIEPLLASTRDHMADLPWGVGLLGFLPAELKKEQFAAVTKYKPPCAIIAGGRASHADELEAEGISTYLHVPTLKILTMLRSAGAGKFVFEGRECGGHVGPLSSFVLWDCVVNTLLEEPSDRLKQIQVLFAGGIHDGLSAAMLSAIVAPLAERGVKVGVVMGTAYLFTKEAVESGAITPEYQSQAIECEHTVLLDTRPGHASRCAQSPYADEFDERKKGLVRSGGSIEEIGTELEMMNMGRLRLASKGVARDLQCDNECVARDLETQRREGMYMLGELAALRGEAVSVHELHEEVSSGSGRFLKAEAPDVEPVHVEASRREKIAIIGMSCMLPDADGLREYWHNILARHNAVREIDPERWDPALYYSPDRRDADRTYSKWGGFIKDFQFDPTKYGIPPANVKYIEPMQLVALELAWRALEDAGYSNREFPKDRTAVIFGAGQIHDLGVGYVVRTMMSHYLSKVEGLSEDKRDRIIEEMKQILPEWNEDSFPGFLGNIVSGRVANRLDMGGTNFTVDAACASSLASLDVAISKLQNHECDMALAGAGDGTNHAFAYLSFAKTQALSPRGACRPFDDSADGIAISEGCSVVVLKRLVDAMRDGDRIYAVIRGLGSSSDGRNRSITAPHPKGQVTALRRAYEDAGVASDTVELVEAHGTGTVAGDQAEIQSLSEVYEAEGAGGQNCAIGSVKSMIGHTKVGAGMAGLIKCALALNHRILPPTIGVEKPNSKVDFADTRFYINTETRPWFSHSTQHPKRAGVSAFGFGGTNFHSVMEEYTGDYRHASHVDMTARPAEVFFFSGTDRDEVLSSVGRLKERLKDVDNIDLAQLAYSFHLDQSKRSAVAACRLSIVASSVHELRERLDIALSIPAEKDSYENPLGVHLNCSSKPAGDVCFLFPGQGSQSLDMLKDFALSDRAFHDVLEQADALLADKFEQALTDYIYPVPRFSKQERDADRERLNSTNIAQPALGAVEAAAVGLLKRFGLEPDYVAGHSFGEYPALYAAGCITLDDLIDIAALRGEIVKRYTGNASGGMAAVRTDLKKAEEIIKKFELSVSVANANSPEQTVIAGPVEQIDKSVTCFNASGIHAKKLAVRGAFHTKALSEAAERFTEELNRISFKKPACRIFSNTTAGEYPKTAEEIRGLLARHLIEPVQFEQEISKIYDAGARVFVEVGPGKVLGGLVDRILQGREHQILTMAVEGRPEWLSYAGLMAKAFALGLPVATDAWFDGRGLKRQNLDALFDEVQKYVHPASVIWRVNGWRAEPWNRPAKETKSSKQTTMKQIHAEVGNVNNRTGGAPSLDGQKRQGALNGTLSEAAFMQFQSNMAQLIELQKQQQRMLEKMLTMQERMLLGGEVSELEVDYALQENKGTLDESPEAAETQLSGSPPVPNIPGLKVKPSIDARKYLSGKTGAERSVPADALPVDRKKNNGNGDEAHSEGDKQFSVEEFQDELLKLLSERTGYPTEMLGLDMDLEADLGLDSIKMVEIFGALREHNSLLMSQDLEKVMDELSNLRTLRSIIDWYASNRNAQDNGNGSAETVTSEDVKPSDAELSSPKEHDPVKRYVLEPFAAPVEVGLPGAAMLRECPVLLVGETPGLSGALHGALDAAGCRFRQIVPGKVTKRLSEKRIEADLSSPESVQELRKIVLEDMGEVGAIFNLMDYAISSNGNGTRTERSYTAELLLLVQAFEQELLSAASTGGGWLVNFSFMDGTFGLSRGVRSALQGGSIGLLKSVAREYTDLKVKCIDIDPELDAQVMASHVLAELSSADPAVEIGFNEGGRWKLRLNEQETSPSGPTVSLNSDSVVLVTGGAYGITAEALKAMAKEYKPTIVLIGRSSLPEEEPSETRKLGGNGELKAYLIQNMQEARPADIENRLNEILKNREIRENLSQMEQAGARVEYHSVDVRDAERFSALIDEVYKEYGRIDGVIHGAGVNDDRRVKDKTVSSFESVFSTKVSPALVLEEKLNPETLKFFLFFSSVTARFGSFGQCDYSAANEVLNKLADKLDKQWPGRVVAINWGPWDGGMFTDELRRLYEKNGINPIPVEKGVEMFMSEVIKAEKGSPEVIISCSVQQIQDTVPVPSI